MLGFTGGFSSEKYVAAQKQAILKRLEHFAGKLYIEIGGKFLYDGYASRVLPGFDPTCKLKLFQGVNSEIQRRCASSGSSADNDSDERDGESDQDLEVILCISARDIVGGRVWSEGKSYMESLFDALQDYEIAGITRKPLISLNMCSRDPDPKEIALLEELSRSLSDRGYQLFRRYIQPGYPSNVEFVVSEKGYGADEYITVQPGGITLVTALGSSCGKLSTCLGQVYMDSQRNIISGYCKYELFPIHNLLLYHPINCAYEAATADIHDHNLVDHWHLEAYGTSAINYNRDVEAWPILAALIQAVIKKSREITGADANGNWMVNYRSPTDMGVNMVADGILSDASIAEINRRITEYEALVPQKPVGDSSLTEQEFYLEKVAVVKECRDVLSNAVKYDIPTSDEDLPTITSSSK